MSKTSTSTVHLLRLECGSANAIDERLLEALTDGLTEASETDKRAVVITGYDNYFSAGLNLKGLPDDRDGMESFIERFEAAHMSILTSPMPIVAAVNGHAVAGGCILACACDLRVGASGAHKLGVSEVTLGVSFPASAFEIMRETLVPQWTPSVLLGGRLLSPANALEAGILHEVVPPEELLDEALARAAELGDKPRSAFHHSKLALRRPLLERVEETRLRAKDEFLDSWFSPEVVERRKQMLAS